MWVRLQLAPPILGECRTALTQNPRGARKRPHHPRRPRRPPTTPPTPPPRATRVLPFMNANKSLIFGIINRGLVLGRCGAGSGCRQLAEVADPARVIFGSSFFWLGALRRRPGPGGLRDLSRGQPGCGKLNPTPWLFTIMPALTPRFLGVEPYRILRCGGVGLRRGFMI